MCFCYYFYVRWDRQQQHRSTHDIHVRIQQKLLRWERKIGIVSSSFSMLLLENIAKVDIKNTTTINRERGKFSILLPGTKSREKNDWKFPKCVRVSVREVKRGARRRKGRCENLVRQESSSNSLGKRLSFWNRLRHKSFVEEFISVSNKLEKKFIQR